MTYLSDKQVAKLLEVPRADDVAVLDGLSHMEAWKIRRTLNQIFGFGRWSGKTVSDALIYEVETTTKSGKPAFKVAYKVSYSLSVSAPDGTLLCEHQESAVGESVMPDFKRGDCHDMALKTAQSQALKRCAVNLGDKLGLCLYDNGQRVPTVKMTLVAGLPTEEEPAESEEQPATVALPAQSVRAPIAPLEATLVEGDSAPSVLALREQILALVDSPPEGKVARIKARHDMLLRLQHLGWESAPTTDEAGESVTLAALVERISA